VRELGEIRATLDGEGELERLPFMPEMARHSGQSTVVSAVMTKICGGGRGMRTVLGGPLILLDDLRCDGGDHGQCNRRCTLLWKPAWLRPEEEGSAQDPGGGLAGVAPSAWPYRTRAENGAYRCQATALPRATLSTSTPKKLLLALQDLRQGEWSISSLAGVYLQTLAHRLGSLRRRAAGITRSRRTPVERLGLRPGDWVEVKSLAEISATLDRNGRNRGLEFSRYMIPFCGGTYRVDALMENFIDERSGELRRLENTVLLEGVTCGGETTSGPCRRAELLYWREIWLRRAATPPPRF
jgi:hypothetical protein